MNTFLKFTSRVNNGWNQLNKQFITVSYHSNLNLNKQSQIFAQKEAVNTFLISRSIFTFRPNKKLIINQRATRPKKSQNDSIELNYEQAQFAEKIGVTKSWNSWNTSNLVEGKRQAESAFDDFFLRKFLYGTFHGLFASEIIIKRRFNTINISFLVKLPRQFYPQKVYFLVGYSEEILSSLFKCVVRIYPQTIKNTKDIVFRNW